MHVYVCIHVYVYWLVGLTRRGKELIVCIYKELCIVYVYMHIYAYM